VGVKPSIIADPKAALKQARSLLAVSPAAAVKQARQMLDAHSHDPAVLRVIAAGLRKLGEGNEAAELEKRAIQASIQNPAHRDAARAVAAGDTKRANKLLEAILAEDGTDVVALVMLGSQLSLNGEYETAEPLLRRAIEGAPDDVPARMALVEHLHRARRGADALKELDTLDPDAQRTALARSLRAHILRDLGRQEEEVEILGQLAATEPRPESYNIRMGHALRNLGRVEQAVAAYRQVLETSPFEGSSWWSLANLKTVKFSDDDIATMERGIAVPKALPLNVIRLHFALGKALDDRGAVERAFHYYNEGNRLRDRLSTYTRDYVTRWVDHCEATYTPQFFSERAGAGFPAPDPIFVIGMQRSGSTLIEQILDSHPMIEGTAELTELPTIIREQGEIANRRGISFNEHLRRMTPDDLHALGQEYLRRSRTYRLTDKPFFTDKMPTNWLYAGIIRLILPDAKIVDVRRHPLDCCFANWKQLYGKGLEHTYSMEAMGRYYADYVRLLRLMERVQPGKIHRVIYERVVDDLEGEVRHLLDYLGLPFDEACLDFHSNERSVRTISAEQVRRPINRRGLDRWKPYEKWLGPLKDALGPALEDWQV
jgi:tetratricopeptide (TPR) repeat protein